MKYSTTVTDGIFRAWRQRCYWGLGQDERGSTRQRVGQVSAHVTDYERMIRCSRAAMFQPTDVTDWLSLRSLFDSAFERFGRVDHVVANAANPEKDTFLTTDTFDEDGQLAAPDLRILDVNTGGVLRSRASFILLSWAFS